MTDVASVMLAGGWADVPRFVALVLGSALIGVTVVIVAVYTSIYRVHRRLVKAHTIPAWRGLLPRHVALIGVCLIGLVVATMVDMAGYLRTDLTWRPFTYGALYALGLSALWDVLGSSRHRKHEYDLRVRDMPARKSRSDR